MRPNIVAGNWKMNGSLSMATDLVEQLKALEVDQLETQVLICPPMPYLASVQGLLTGTKIQLGGQTASEFESGAYTGESSAAMLKDLGASHVIIGHSERRALFGESNECVAKKFVAVQTAGLKPILCVGETLEQREAEQAQAVIAEQLNAVIGTYGVDVLQNAVVAYEPVWAIGTGKTASPEQAQEIHAFIRGLVSGKNSNVAEQLPILYGGSVNAANAADLFAQKDIDGGLVGGASLKAQDFYLICKAAK